MKEKNRIRLIVAVLLTTVWPAIVNAQIAPERSIGLYVEIEAPVEKVWKQWTTPAGISAFFAPASKIDIKPLGSFDIYFMPDAPAGLRGAEGNFVLAVEENEMLSFTWDAPPDWPEIRRQRTAIVLRFERLAANRTRLIFRQSGWGSGKQWTEVYEYFKQAWRDVVLPNLKYSLEVGPLDWRDFPKRLPANLPPAKVL